MGKSSKLETISAEVHKRAGKSSSSPASSSSKRDRSAPKPKPKAKAKTVHANASANAKDLYGDLNQEMEHLQKSVRHLKRGFREMDVKINSIEKSLNVSKTGGIEKGNGNGKGKGKGKGRGKGEKKEKDPNKPKMGSSAWIHFCSEKRDEEKTKPEKERNSAKEQLVAFSILWKKMSDDEKKPYEELAAKDKERYQKEMEVYKNGGNGDKGDKGDEGEGEEMEVEAEAEVEAEGGDSSGN